MAKKSVETAMNKFNEGVQLLSTEKEISEFCQMLCSLSAKTIHGIEGRSFKKAFLGEAIKDNDFIKPKMRH